MRRNSLLQQSCLRFLLLWQGLAVRGHNRDQEGNLRQLLIMMSKETSPVMRQWLTEKYMSPEVVNELISMMGQSVLRKLLCHIKRVTPHWFGIIADEATDVSNREQLNLSIRWVNDNYEVFEDPVGLFTLHW